MEEPKGGLFVEIKRAENRGLKIYLSLRQSSKQMLFMSARVCVCMPLSACLRV